MRWTHPSKPWLKLRRKDVAVLAVIEMGIHDHATIAWIVGLKPEDVARIDRAEETAVRELVLEGIPDGEFFTLARQIRCPQCGARLTLAPCVTCQSRRKAPSQFDMRQQGKNKLRGVLPRCGIVPRADKPVINEKQLPADWHTNCK